MCANSFGDLLLVRGNRQIVGDAVTLHNPRIVVHGDLPADSVGGGYGFRNTLLNEWGRQRTDHGSAYAYYQLWRVGYGEANALRTSYERPR